MNKITRVKLLIDPDMPAAKQKKIEREIKSTGISIVSKGADAGIVVGGDGVFGFYGKKESLPLLFVGKNSSSVLGSKSLLAEVHIDDIYNAIHAMMKGSYAIERYERLDVIINGRRVGDVFTDVYMQRGVDSNALRYELMVYGNGKVIKEFVISDGVIISTSAGATGYFSYPNKIVFRDMFDPSGFEIIDRKEIGVCHILPTYIHREHIGKGENLHSLRYRVPIDSKITIRLKRRADARLYGVGDRTKGRKVGVNDVITILAGRSHTALIKLPQQPEK